MYVCVVAEVGRSWCPFLAMTGPSLKAPNVVSGRVYYVYVCCMYVCVLREGGRWRERERERE